MLPSRPAGLLARPDMTDAHSMKTASGVDPTVRPRLARHPVVLIAAVARNAVIGREGALPWFLPGDLEHFRVSTMGRPVLMGRKTFDTVGEPLPGRTTIVVSNDPGFAPPGTIAARTLADAFRAADVAAEAQRADAIMVAGGGVIYAATIADADRLLVTEIEAEPEGDTFFPPIDRRRWVMAERRAGVATPDDTARYSITRWERRPAEDDPHG